MNANTVLSITTDQAVLASREVALRNGGMTVISVMSPIQARFEIEMGRCGILLICYRLSDDAANELTRLFREYCPEGHIVFVTRLPSEGGVPADVDIAVPESSGPDKILQELKRIADADAHAA
jgi:hypothetical protein